MSEPTPVVNSSSGPTQGRVHGRARGRELGLWLLSHVEPHTESATAAHAAVELFFDASLKLDASDPFLGPHAGELISLLDDRVARRWARRLLAVYLDDPRAIDDAIESASQRWRLDRMDRVDRNLLRLCAVELLHESTPRNVVVAEAVRLAARYGSERSAAFVNALAEALARSLRDASRPEAEDAEETEAEETEAEETGAGEEDGEHG